MMRAGAESFGHPAVVKSQIQEKYFSEEFTEGVCFGALHLKFPFSCSMVSCFVLTSCCRSSPSVYISIKIK